MWDEKGYPVEDDSAIGYSPCIMFTLLNRSSDPIELYDISFIYMTARDPRSGEGLKTSVTLPCMLKPHDYQNFVVVPNGEFEKPQLMYTWNRRNELWFAPGFSITSNVQIRTSKGVVIASIRGFSKLDNFRRRLNFRLSFWRSKTFRRNSVKPFTILLDRRNWWE